MDLDKTSLDRLNSSSIDYLGMIQKFKCDRLSYQLV